MITAVDKRVNSIILKKGLLSKEKINEAIEVTKKESLGFVDVLIERNILNEDVILSALAEDVRIPPISIEKIHPDEKALKDFPEEKAKSFSALPISKIGNILTIVVSNPFDIFKLDDIRMITNCELRLVLALERNLQRSIKRFYNPEDHKLEELLQDVGGPEMELKEDSEDEELDLFQITSEAGESPVIKLVNMILMRALKEGSSDIHIEPYEKKIRVRFRQDGILNEIFFPPKRLGNAIASRIKIMCGLDISERRIPQDGKFQIKYSGRRIDFRVSTTPTVHGERVVMRLLDSSSLTLSLKDLGFESRDLDAFHRAINSSYGMVLVTGPTGAGKTTTLYCSLKEIFSPNDNISTVEDPVEYQLPGVIQVPVNPKQGMTFGAALRALLRQDPDIIMIGEMRDLETADIAVKAAITGHLVFSTLHTNDAVSTISRLTDMGIDPFMVASAVLLVTNQRLTRRLCTHCKEPMKLPPERMVAVGFTPQESETVKLFKPVGCPRCHGGYKGRVSLYEVFEVDDEVRKMIIKGSSVIEMREYGVSKGMNTLRRAGIVNVIKGLTSLEEVLSNT
ncbi:MAG: type IV-A pilus assembly ATPase PilB [Planctomycetes bacterium]|nr:type IV-A pilus assembly ATPase PilB [Planctomycetota bacterium]